VPGGRRRQDSVASGLRSLTSNVQGILVHDGARPLLSSAIVVRCIKALEKHPAFLLAITPTDTLHLKVSNCAQPTTSRSTFISAQTPQGFIASLLPDLLANLENPNLNFTDEVTALFHTYGIMAYIIDGERENVKITYPEDLVVFRPLLLKRAREIKKRLCL
ncbi:MAG: 2-C-methyl-D-erythritol 4-phosphate cytidylyltransferase, partial [bacterium]